MMRDVVCLSKWKPRVLKSPVPEWKVKNQLRINQETIKKKRRRGNNLLGAVPASIQAEQLGNTIVEA